MKINKIGSYPSKKNKLETTFVYEVSGTDAELLKYRELKGDNYQQSPSGKPIYWSSRAYLPDTILKFNFKGDGVFADTSELDDAAALARQYGGNLGQSIAEYKVQEIFGKRKQSSTPVPQEPEHDGDPEPNPTTGDNDKIDKQ